jgi:hypothetical protein
MSAMRSLLRCELGAHHNSHSNTIHHIVDQSAALSFPPSVALEIVQHEGDAHFYLIYIPHSGPSADTFHLTLDDAKHQAEWEFGVEEDEWVRTERPFP